MAAVRDYRYRRSDVVEGGLGCTHHNSRYNFGRRGLTRVQYIRLVYFATRVHNVLSQHWQV